MLSFFYLLLHQQNKKKKNELTFFFLLPLQLNLYKNQVGTSHLGTGGALGWRISLALAAGEFFSWVFSSRFSSRGRFEKTKLTLSSSFLNSFPPLPPVPAVVLTLGGLLLPDTPNSLAARGKRQEALAVLRRVRGVEDVDAEFRDICAAADAADGASASGGSGWAMILRSKYRPELTMAVLIPLFQQLTGEGLFF